ncbi:hypothetical protein G9A89_023423 [Geosiphon pyriformis]|nr:hypothetical protein G9A89_023423 [Geosiphon pyriformis]
MKAYCVTETKNLGQEIRAGIFVDGSEIILTVKGESAIEDWENRQNEFIKYPKFVGAQVDKFFYTNYLRTQDKMSKMVLNSLRGKARNFVAVGHGLGGVYATFAILDLIYTLNFNIVLTLITFGQPHMGDKKFAQYLNEIKGLHAVRLTNMDDYVPKLPVHTSLDFIPYHHPFVEYWIETNDDCDCTKSKVFGCIGPTTMNDGVLFTEESQVFLQSPLFAL